MNDIALPLGLLLGLAALLHWYDMRAESKKRRHQPGEEPTERRRSEDPDDSGLDDEPPTMSGGWLG